MLISICSFTSSDLQHYVYTILSFSTVINVKAYSLLTLIKLEVIADECTGVATMGPRGAMAPSLLSCFGAVSMSWFTFAIASILCCGPLTCLLLATPLDECMPSCTHGLHIL